MCNVECIRHLLRHDLWFFHVLYTLKPNNLTLRLNIFWCFDVLMIFLGFKVLMIFLGFNVF